MKNFRSLLIRTNYRPAGIPGFFGLITILFAQSAFPVTPLPGDASLDLSTREICYPVEFTDTSQFYDVCMKLDTQSPGFTFYITSSVERNDAVTDMATYSQADGLEIPLVRLSNGNVYLNATFSASVDTSTNDTIFTLTGAEKAMADPKKHSVARIWNEQLLEGIRNDLARPTVHARNLFHTSVVMYDAWAIFDDTAETYLLGKNVHGFDCPFDGMPTPADINAAREEAISYAAYRLLKHRFVLAPGAAIVEENFDEALATLGYDRDFDSQDYSTGDAAALGNYIAQCMIDYGHQDGANEVNNYTYRHYEPANTPLAPTEAGTEIQDPDHWQPLSFSVFRDQSGNIFYGNTPEFVGPEWGNVYSFALSEEEKTVYHRNDFDWWVFHDPGSPPLLEDKIFGLKTGEIYKWTHTLVGIWSSQLDPHDGVLWDISPASIGNLKDEDYPTSFNEYKKFYDLFGGGDPSTGYDLNPITGEPYEPQIVPRGDYARVLAEFWADGPNSETPPGHWFVILNYVNDHPLVVKKFRGEGEVLDDLEWDVKGYFALGGGVHDAAVTAWGIKGWYDYVRPISALRYMAGQGQSTDPGDLSYDPEGIELEPGYIELVREGDSLAGEDNENVGKIKFYAWRAHEFVPNPEVDQAGVGWILAENWWPYQRPTFVTPPFAGYISGHSTYSRTGAEILSRLTGSEYFPGGLGEFEAPKNEFLVFEEGPSVDVTLQWARYRDASDQCSLSRIWGGIHPPADDMPGRKIGAILGPEAFEMAEKYFNGTIDQ